MAPRFSAALRILTVLLLALAVSPLTAPFSTAHPSQLVGTADPDDGLLVGARKAPDEPIAGLDGRAPAGRTGRIVIARGTRLGPGEPRGVDTPHLPLRI